MICCLNHPSFNWNAGFMFTLPTARFQVWVLATPSWQAPIWIVLRRLEYNRTNQHSLKRRRWSISIFCRLGPFLSKCCLWAPSQMEMWNKFQPSVKRYIWCVRVTLLWRPLLLECKGVTWVRKHRNLPTKLTSIGILGGKLWELGSSHL